MKCGTLIIIGLGLLIAGCQTGGGTRSDQWVLIPKGSTVVVNQDLKIDVGNARVFFQEGRTVAKNDIDRFNDNCNIERKAISTEDETRYIRAGEYVTGPVNRPRFVGVDTTQRDFDQRVPLKSASEPDVRALKCTYDGDPRTQRYMSINRIQATLGSLVTLELSEDIPDK